MDTVADTKKRSGICRTFFKNGLLGFGDCAELTGALTSSALDALGGIDTVRLAHGAGDGISRAVTGAKAAAFALFRIDLIGKQRPAMPSGTPLFLDMGFILIPEIMDGGQHRVRRSLAKAAQGGCLDLIAQFL